jgi:hypothetical protein
MDTDFALCLTEEVAAYMKAKFLHQLHSKGDHVSFPAHWDLTLLQECDQAVDILVQAYCNTCKRVLLHFRGTLDL